MNKSDAIQILGGSISTAAKTVGTSYQAVSKWPDVLPRRIEDRVIAAIARKWLPPEAFRPALDFSASAPPPRENPNTYRPAVGADQMETAHG